ncbi:MAG TPA: fibronectin type III domain-containing protein [Candidatus Anammoximicrobium sp.]|nr:fibronectin type III domain-containing protein [Candidatus Anammoximicrobium sp.]
MKHGRKHGTRRRVCRLERLETRWLLSADSDGLLAFSSPVNEPEAIQVLSLPSELAEVSLSEASYPLSSVPLLSSDPAAAAKVFLDFDGAPAQVWGSYQAAETPAFDQDGDPTTFSDLELEAMAAIWAQVAEAFSPFEVDVTTIDPGNRDNLATEAVVFGGDGAWTGGNYGGVSLIGGFYNAAPNTVFVFTDNLADGNVKFSSRTAAHELGHSFGLQHQSSYDADGNLISEYNMGNSLVAPLMGSAFVSARGVWYSGPTPYGTMYTQDDIAVLTNGRNGWGLRSDDHGETYDSATLAASDGSSFSGAGIITSTMDRDLFRLDVPAGTLEITADVAAAGPMLDLRLELLDAGGTIAVADTENLGELLTADVAAGTYWVSIGSQGEYGDLGQYTFAATVTAAGIPAAPSDLAVTAVSATVAGLSWQDNSTDEDGFRIERSDNGGTSWVTLAAAVAGDTYQDAGRTAGATYLYRVCAVAGSQISDYSNMAGVTMVPQAPSNLTATAASTTVVNLAWQDNCTWDGGFKVQQSTNGGGTWTTLTSSAIASTTYQKTGLTAGTTYWYRVFAMSGTTQSDYSEVVQVTTLPAAPASPRATAMTFSQIKITWKNVAGETDYRIERSPTGTTGWTLDGTVPAETLVYYSNGLAPSTKYYYRVFAENGSGSSAASSTVSTTTLAAPIPAAPGDPAAAAISADQIGITWNDVLGEASYRIERSLNDTSGWASVGTVGADTWQFTDTGLAAAARHYYRVFAINSTGTSPASSVVSAITWMTAPALTAASSREIQLSWSDVAGETGYGIERAWAETGPWTQVGLVEAGTLAYSDTGLAPQTTYYYRLFAVTAAGNSPASAAVSATTPQTPAAVPAAPDAPLLAVISDSHIRISWNGVAEAASYRIERSLTGAGDWTPAGPVPAGTLALDDTGLAAQTTYYYRVFALNELGSSAASAVVSATTPLPAPLAPAGLAVSVVTSHELRVTWNDVANEAAYRVERSLTGTGGWTAVGTVPADTLALNDTGLQQSTKYYYRVFAVNATGESPASAVVSATTPATPTAIPAAPSSPKATVISSSQINISWRNVSNESSYRIERSPTGSGDWTPAGTVPADIVLYADTGLAPSTKYYYRVFAVNELGSSAASAVVSGITKAPPPLAPSDLRTTSIGRTSVSLAWSDNATNESGFKIERSTNGTSWSQLGTTSANVTTYSYSKLSANTTYYFRVRSYNAAGNSEYSNVITFKTLA